MVRQKCSGIRRSYLDTSKMRAFHRQQCLDCGQMNRSCSKTRHHTFASRIRKKTSQIEVKLTVWTMSGKPNGQYGT